MLKQIIEAYRTSGMMDRVEHKVRSMLHLAREIFTASSLALLERREVAYDLYARDRQINQLVVEVRRMMVEHLSVNASRSVGGSTSSATCQC